jgi:tetratricopeptide (TPR) repeat protein
LGVFTLVLWFLNFFKWKAGWKIQFSSLDFWIGALAGLGGILYFSPPMETPGPTALWFVAGLGWTVLKLMEKGTEKKQNTFISGGILAWIGAGCLLLTIGVPWIPGLGSQLGHPYFPQQHAMNLLETLGPKSILVCQDPFDAVACREARLMEPVAMDAVILDEQYMDQRWYLTQVIQKFPEVLFSDLTGAKEDLLKTLIMNNRDLWEIYWDLPVLPPEWEGPPAVPTVLAQEFEGPTVDFIDPEKVQYHFDLGALPEGDQATGGANSVYFSRYVLGFNELGKYLLGKGRYPAAIHAFERSVKLDLAFREPQTYLAQMFSKENILEAARLQFENTIKTHPQKISGLMRELEEAQKANDDGKTVTMLDQMIHLNADLADAEYQLSKIYEKEGRAKESKAMLESSLAMNPQQLEAQMSMGRLMARLGNRIKAESAFRAVLEIDPQNKEAQVEMWKLLNKP